MVGIAVWVGVAVWVGRVVGVGCRIVTGVAWALRADGSDAATAVSSLPLGAV